MRKTAIIAGLFVAGLLAFASTTSVRAEEIAQPNTNTPQPVMVEVIQNDSLSKIASKHQTTYVRLFDANTFIQDPDVIHPGEKVRIPNTDEQIPSRNLPLNTSKPEVVKPAVKRQNKATKNSKNIKKQKSETTNNVKVAEGDVWDSLARCESGGNWAINTGNGYYGGLQFTASTWKSVGGSGLPHQASREEQIMRGQILQARSGWGQWPACTKKLGLR